MSVTQNKNILIANTKVNYLKFIVSSFLVFVLVSFLGSFSFHIKLIFGSILYFFFTVLSIKYFKTIKPIFILIFILCPLLFFNLRIGLSNFERNWVVVPSTVFLILSTIFGFLFSKTTSKVIPSFLLALICTWYLFFSEKYEDKMQYGVTKHENINFSTPQFKLYSSKGVIFNTTLSHKILILDFWNTYCGPCYELFPTIDTIYKKLDTSKYEIATVNIPFSGDKKEDNYNILDKYNYSFVNLFAEDKKIADSFGVKYYPTTIVIKGNNVIYRGDFVTGLKKLKILE